MEWRLPIQTYDPDLAGLFPQLLYRAYQIGSILCMERKIMFGGGLQVGYVFETEDLNKTLHKAKEEAGYGTTR